MEVRSQHSAILALLLLLTSITYANSLNNPFVVDDQHIIVRNLLLRQWTLKDILTSHLFAPIAVETQYYRPLTLLSFALDYAAFGLNPVGYHVGNLILHVLVVILACVLFSRFVSPWIAGFSAALFAVHPANVQAVTYISSRSDPLYTALTLLSLLCWIKGREARGAAGAAVRSFSLLFFFFALTAKESAIVAPALILLTDLTWTHNGPGKQRLSHNWVWYLGLAMVFGVYLTLRIGLGGYGLTMEASPEAWKAGAGLGMDARAWLSLKLVVLYLGVIFYPLHLSFFRDVAVPALIRR